MEKKFKTGLSETFVGSYNHSIGTSSDFDFFVVSLHQKPPDRKTHISIENDLKMYA